MTDNREPGSSLPRLTRFMSALSTASLWLAGMGLVLMTAFVAW